MSLNSSAVDACQNNNGGCSDICEQTEAGYRCLCETGFMLLPDARTCVDVDECADANGGCSDTCLNTIGSFSCGCREGFEYDVNADQCRGELTSHDVILASILTWRHWTFFFKMSTSACLTTAVARTGAWTWKEGSDANVEETCSNLHKTNGAASQVVRKDTPSRKNIMYVVTAVLYTLRRCVFNHAHVHYTINASFLVVLQSLPKTTRHKIAKRCSMGQTLF